jgi:hypothetical protein
VALGKHPDVVLDVLDRVEQRHGVDGAGGHGEVERRADLGVGKATRVAHVDQFLGHVDALHRAVARQRAEHPAGAAADVQQSQVAPPAQLAVQQVEEDAPPADEPEMGLLQLDELVECDLLHRATRPGRSRSARP